MRIVNRLRIFCGIFFVFYAVHVFPLVVPPLQGSINDYAHLLTPQEEAELETYLRGVDQQTDLQIAVLTIPSLEEESLEDYAIRVADTWRIGTADKNSGIILLIAAQDRKIRIEVGYGLEHLITDAHANRIIRTVIAPHFKRNEYGQGIGLAVKNLVGIALKDETLLYAVEQQTKAEDPIPLPLILLFIIIYLLGAKAMPGGLFWPLLLVLSSRSSNYSGRSGSFSSGGHFSSGGGSFGGGGSSGSW